MERTLKERLNDAKENAKIKMGQAYVWCKENPKAAATLATMTVTGVIEVSKIIAKKGVVEEQRRLKDNYIYDRRAGHYVETCRKLKNSEWIQFDERRDRGESVSEILRDMKLLK